MLLPLEKQPLNLLVEMDLQVMFEKYRRPSNDWALPLYDMKPPKDQNYLPLQNSNKTGPMGW